MKRLKRVLYAVLSLCLLFGTAEPVSAKGEEYTYTVRFFAGKQGSFAEGEMMVFEGLHYGDRVNFYYNAVTLNDNSKYYIRGIRESGKDNSDSTQTSSFQVTGDRDYVVAYGILGDATSYTINYVDTEGNTLAPSETYYGNVGDRPVVAYIYIEGWVPQAYNLTRTLEKDPAENVFDFVYTRDAAPALPAEPPAPAPAPEPAPAPGTPGGVTVVPAPPEGETPPVEGGTVPGGGVTPVGGGAVPGGGAGAAGQEIMDDPTPAGNVPDQLRDLDEEETPLSNFMTVAADARLLGIPVPVVIVLALGAVAAAWYFLLLKRRKKQETEEGEH